MAGNSGPNIVADNVVFAIDGANIKSYNSGSAPGDVLNVIDTSMTGSLQSGTSYTNNAWDFDGTDDYIDFGTYDITTSNITCEAWVNISSYGGQSCTYRVLNKYEYTSPGTGFMFGVSQGGAAAQKVAFSIHGTGNVNSTTTLNTGTWYHICATYDGSDAHIYINGLLDNSNIGINTTLLNNVYDLLVGWDTLNSCNCMNGKISNVKIYNKVLSAKEVLQNYNTTKHRFGIK